MLNRLRKSLSFRVKRFFLRKALRHKGCHIDSNTKLSILGTFNCGARTIIYGNGIDNLCGSQLVVLPNAVLTIGHDCGISQTSIICKKSITIGDYVKIGAGTIIMDSNFHSLDWSIRRDTKVDQATSVNKPVIINDDVFIGARCIIGKGVTIGSRSIIAAGSVVMKSIPEDCIAAGNPCVVVKNMNDNEIINSRID